VIYVILVLTMVSNNIYGFIDLYRQEVKELTELLRNDWADIREMVRIPQIQVLEDLHSFDKW
jgi:hypothetical protein